MFLPLAKNENESIYLAIQAGRCIEKMKAIFSGKDFLSPIVGAARAVSGIKD